MIVTDPDWLLAPAAFTARSRSVKVPLGMPGTKYDSASDSGSVAVAPPVTSITMPVGAPPP